MSGGWWEEGGKEGSLLESRILARGERRELPELTLTFLNPSPDRRAKLWPFTALFLAMSVMALVPI